MAPSKASNYFQHLETRCPSLPQILQGSPMDFLVLEEDSPDLEELPFLGLDCGLEGDYVDGFEGCTHPTKSLGLWFMLLLYDR